MNSENLNPCASETWDNRNAFESATAIVFNGSLVCNLLRCPHLLDGVAFRCVRLGMDDDVWAPTTFTNNRDRPLEGDIAGPSSKMSSRKPVAGACSRPCTSQSTGPCWKRGRRHSCHDYLGYARAFIFILHSDCTLGQVSERLLKSLCSNERTRVGHGKARWVANCPGHDRSLRLAECLFYESITHVPTGTHRDDAGRRTPMSSPISMTIRSSPLSTRPG